MELDTSISASSHPRRPPAHRSVSLRHPSPPKASKASSHEPEAGPVNYPPPQTKRPSSSPSSLKALIGKDDSGESSNAEKWFDKSNNHASGNDNEAYVDGSPPFFLQNSSSEETPFENGAPRSRHATQHISASAASLPFHTGLLHLGTDNSSTEDFRSVIDDLTVQNKKLKRKLRTYEKTRDSHLKDQKLFEVRVHGLPTQKKRELEDVLRQFAMNLAPQQGGDSSMNFYNTPLPHTASLPRQKSGSTSASNLNTDSAYVSASASGQGSGRSGQGSSSIDSRQKPSTRPTMTSRQQNVQSYLHDIPEGLMPRHAAVMTERARKKLVVRRLEHIFAGQMAMQGGNMQPQQQQEVSQQAASNDRRAIEEGGKRAPREGHREALIMTEATAATKEAKDASSQSKHSSQSKAAANSALEQRPTRPLDLDLYRAQVPADNFDYIRHLGFSPPGADAMTPPPDGHGWIYLNLLANMAQLHTVNVTGEFVRKAVQEHSKKFELSADGRKIRWRGGKSMTKHSSDGSGTPSVTASGPNQQSSERDSPRKRRKTSMQGSSSGNSGTPVEHANKLSYTPLFNHRSSNNDSDVSSSSEAEDMTNESTFPVRQAGDSSGMTSSGVKTTSTKRKRARENGPIIFYNNAKFCTDLSGDAKNEEAMTYNAVLYHHIVQQAVGTSNSGSISPSSSFNRGPAASLSELPEAMDLDDNPVPAELEVKFPSPPAIANQTPKHRNAIQFEVSGLGGVCPADNFTINVQSRHAKVDDTSAPREIRQEAPPRYPAKIAQVLGDDQRATGRKARSAFHKEVLDTHREEHAPSRLPDASHFMPVGDTTPEDDDDDDDDTSDEEDVISVHSDDLPPAAAPQLMELDYSSDNSSSEDEDYDDDSESDGSVDLLATAREIDPDAIRAREREYDANMAERLAEEIPAGSSAATAGGGSGFASPASGVDADELDIARREYRAKQRRARSSAEGK